MAVPVWTKGAQCSAVTTDRRNAIKLTNDDRIGWTGGDHTAAPRVTAAGRGPFDMEHRAGVTGTARTRCPFPDVAVAKNG